MGVERVAFVLPEYNFAKLAVKLYTDFTNRRANNTFRKRASKTIERATVWLKRGVAEEEVSDF